MRLDPDCVRDLLLFIEDMDTYVLDEDNDRYCCDCRGDNVRGCQCVSWQPKALTGTQSSATRSAFVGRQPLCASV